MSKNLRNPSAQLNSFPVNQRLGVFGAGGRNQSAFKLADQTVNNSAVFVNDSDLSVYLATAPKNCYYVKIVAQLSIAAAANNIRWTLVAPDGLVLASSSRWFGELKVTAAASQIDSNITSLGSALVGGTTTSWSQLIVEGLFCPEQPGTLQFQFAQNVAGATNTTVRAGSFMAAWELPA
jgi:hypothetical protein